jgi:2',3'-cyclic-nucleotide 2'-phosphodiesterase (5'-nucleotidase family)
VSVVTDPTAKTPTYEPLMPDQTYTVMATDYVANVAAGYKDLFDQAQNKTDTGQIVNDAVIADIKANSPVSAQIEGRITVTEGVRARAGRSR